VRSSVSDSIQPTTAVSLGEAVLADASAPCREWAGTDPQGRNDQIRTGIKGSILPLRRTARCGSTLALICGGYRRQEGSEGTLGFGFAVIEPVLAPDAVECPAEALQVLLAEPVAVTGGGGGVVSGAFLGHEQNALAASGQAGDQVSDRLRFAGSRRPVNDQVSTVDRAVT
jgi:hypothetical protein